MLREIQIENIAVIEKADIAFTPGLNVMTGETGAGKSIIIDSIAAVTGARVSRDLIRTGAEKGLVTAVFDRDAAENWLTENEIDCEDDQLIVQRRIQADGKSSCRVAGVPVTAGQLRTLGEQLLELHGQNDGLRLLDERQHLEALDRYAGLDLDPYRKAYDRYRGLQKELDRLGMDENEKERLQEILSDTVRELENAKLIPGEYEEISKRRDMLRNSEKLTESIQEALSEIGGDEGASAGVQNAAYYCRHAEQYAQELSDVSEKLTQAGYLISDAEELLRDFLDALNFEPDEYNRLEQRLHDLARLERKYRKTVDELPDYLEECRERLEEISFSDERIRKLEKMIAEEEAHCRKLADELHRRRAEAALALSRQIEEELHALSMPSARLRVELTQTRDLTRDGNETAAFLLAANRGEEPGRISRIASGGELSRVMLAMKNVLSRNDPVGTMIFDEIDTGVSGIAAQRVGEKLAELSGRKQVLCVTHLPQLASLADTHFVITKNESGGRTRTSVTLLDREGRRKELARLHGGDNVTETTLRSAEEQLSHAEEVKEKLRHMKTKREEENNGSL
ncbi:MAG: DNA repair protein RecN [Oscillospiraceae bacterium]|nr:DNA repair protein RecN [Oscillospiraceae bacterium]